MNDNFSNEQNNQFVLSYELLHLLNWLVRNDADKLKKIIGSAIAAGLHENIQNTSANDNKQIATEEMYNGIIDFFELMEDLLHETINEQVAQKAKEKNLMPAIDHIDSNICDDATIRFSVEKTTNQLAENPETNAKDQLFKELLRRWKPQNKNAIN